MKIVIVTHYFPPEIGAPQSRLSDIARKFAESEEVVVVTGMPNHPTGVVHEGYKHKIRSEEYTDGYKILRSWVYATPNEGFVKKTFGHLSFMISSILFNLRRIGRADIVLVSSPTFFAIFSAYFVAKIKRAKFVLEIRDLWPGIFIELGVLTNKYIISVLSKLEMYFYEKCDLLVVVTEGFKDNIVSRGISPDKVFVVRNGADISKFNTSAGNRNYRTGLKVTESQVIVLYSGAHGISHGLDSVIKAAGLLADRKDIIFVFVGEGAKKAELVEQAAGLDNVMFMPAARREAMPDIIFSSDICLAPLKNIPLFSTFIPSKIFEYMACSRPVIGCLSGEPAKILEEAGQFVVEPEQPKLLADCITKLADDPNLRQKKGLEGRLFVESNFNRDLLSERYLSLIRTI